MILQNDKNVFQAPGTPMPGGLNKGVYSLKYDEMRGFYLHVEEPFTFPDKMYGDDDDIIRRAITKFNSIDRNLGVLLTGLKGSGKTLTAKKLCVESGLPVIIIPKYYEGPAFIEFMTSSELGSCVVFIDEFEKLYYGDCGDGQISRGSDDMLRILDGPYTTHNMFVFTTNTDMINECLINRPSRIFYRKNYGSLGNEVVRAVAEDMLADRSYVDDLINTCSILPFVSFDILTSLINESNLFGERPSECVRYMNLVRDSIYIRVFQVMPDGKRLLDATYDSKLNPSVFTSYGGFGIMKYIVRDGELALDERGESVYTNETICSLDIKPSGKIGEYTYVDDDGTEFIIRKVDRYGGGQTDLTSDGSTDADTGKTIIGKAQIGMIENKMIRDNSGKGGHARRISDEIMF